MLGIDSSELLLIALVALVVIGPKDLPKAMRFVGYWVGRARGVARQFRSGFDAMVREAELEEMEKRWADENARIMSEHPVATDVVDDPAERTTDAIGEAVTVEKPEVVPAPTDTERPRAGEALS